MEDLTRDDPVAVDNVDPRRLRSNTISTKPRLPLVATVIVILLALLAGSLPRTCTVRNIIPWSYYNLLSANSDIPTNVDTQQKRKAMENDYSSVLECPELWSLVSSVVTKAIDDDPSCAPALIRLFFHDCFIQGCDGSILLQHDLDGSASEISAGPNKSLRSLDVIQQIKDEVEEVCPGLVSCADIIVLAAREAVIQAGGPSYPVDLGRFDSLRSNEALAASKLPSPIDNFTVLMAKFHDASESFTLTDVVSLTGAHTLGAATCLTYEQIKKALGADSAQLEAFKRTCEASDIQVTSRIALDSTNSSFDNAFFTDVQQGKGILPSDQTLILETPGVEDAKSLVAAYSTNQSKFFEDFANAMNKMSTLAPPAGSDGEIRVKCGSQNSLLSNTTA